MAWHYLPARLRLSQSLVTPDPRVRETYFLHAGKMFFACNVKNIFAYLLMHFSRIASTAPEAAARRRQGHALRARATAWRPTPRPGDRTPCRANEQRPAGDHAPQSRSRTMARRRQSCTAIKLVAGPALARCSVLPLPMSLLPGSCSLLWLWLGLWSLSLLLPWLWLCRCLEIRAAQGSP